ncbi:sigma factor [Dermatophilaceae bacterium Soc4.6]
MDDVVIPPDVSARPDGRLEVVVADLAGLLDRAVSGDASAAAAAYDLVSVPAYRIVHLVVGDAETASEVCRRGFAHLWDVWSAAPAWVDRPASARTWALMIMHRCATDHVRQVSGGLPRPPLALAHHT